MNPAPLQIGDIVRIVGASDRGENRLHGEIFRIHAIADDLFTGVLPMPFYPASSLRKVRIVEEDELQIGDEVEIIGQNVHNNSMRLGQHFVIEQIIIDSKLGTMYSAPGQLGFPASSLRKLSNNEVNAHLTPDLQIGDYAEVALPDNPFTGKIGRVSSIGKLTVALYGMGIWSRENLRTLTPEEVAMHTGTIGYKMQECQAEMDKAKEALREILAPLVDERLSAIEKRIDSFLQDYCEHKEFCLRLHDRTSAIELIQTEHIENHAALGDKISEVEERLLRNLPRIAELEGLQKEDSGLQRGDFVEVQADGCGKKKGFVFKITYIRTIESSICGPRTYYSANKIPMYTTDELRKLSDEEICQRLNERESA